MKTDVEKLISQKKRFDVGCSIIYTSWLYRADPSQIEYQYN